MSLPGFSESTGTNDSIAIWCNNTKAASWYVRQDEQNVVLPSKLTGRMTGIDQWAVKDGDYEGTQKISFKVTASGQAYSLTTGLSSAFAKGLLGVVATAPAGTFAEDISIVVRNGDKALLCSVYDSKGEWLKGLTDWKTHDWEKITEQAIARFAGKSPEPTAEHDLTSTGEGLECEDSIEVEYNFEDEQPSLLPTRSQAEWSAIIKGLTIGQSEALRSELAADDLGPIKGQLLDNFDSQLKRLNDVKAALIRNSKALSISAAEMSAKLGKPSADCTLAELSAVADSIAPVKETAEIPF